MRLTARMLTAAFASTVLLAGLPVAFADGAVTFELSIKENRFQPAEIKAPSGKPITLKIKNQDQTPEEFESTELKVEKIVAGQSEITVRMRPLKPGRYPFFGEYHQETAKGVLIVE